MPAPADQKRWMDFAKSAGWFPGLINRKGAISFQATKAERDLIFTTYATYLETVLETKPSMMESRYGFALRASKRAGLPVEGLKIPRNIVKKHSRKHTKKKQFILGKHQLGRFLMELCSDIVGPPGKRIAKDRIDIDELKFYFLYVVTITLVARQSSLLPKKVYREHEYQNFLVWGRDVGFYSDNTLRINVITKRERLRKATDPQTLKAPKFKMNRSGLIAFYGPYRAGAIIASRLTPQEMSRHLQKRLRGRRTYQTSDIVRNELTQWLQSKFHKSDTRKALLRTGEIARSFKLTHAGTRSTTITELESLATSVNELVEVTRHSKASTAFDHYIKMKKSQKEGLISKFMTALGKDFAPLFNC